jgi:hypothetical protein
MSFSFTHTFTREGERSETKWKWGREGKLHSLEESQVNFCSSLFKDLNP